MEEWGDNSEVWVPDLTPYSLQEGLVNTMEPTMLTVSSSGSVYMARPGTLKLLCKFSGLVAFPFDTLKCSFEVGGWAWSGNQQNITLYNGVGFSGVEGDGQEASAGASSTYEEYSLKQVKAEILVYSYPEADTDEEEPWPIAIYEVSEASRSLEKPREA